MTSLFKKTILLFILTGVVFFGGGIVRVARGESVSPTVTYTPATNSNLGNGPIERAITAVSGSAGEVGANVSNLGIETPADYEKVTKCGTVSALINPLCFFDNITLGLYKIAVGILRVSGGIFDFMLGLSIDSTFIKKDFVDSLWKTMRDFSNMAFIFILIYTGIKTMFFEEDWQKPVMMVVIIALLINFSLFFTKIIIDAGNVLAVGVYSGMGAGSGQTLSEAMANNFRPEQFFASAAGSDYAAIIYVVAGVVSGFLAFVLFKAAFLFMGRILAFWFLMILSPFAFILLAFPSLGKQIGFSFDKWMSLLIAQSFVAPVFLFFIYMIMKAISEGKGILAEHDPGASFLGTTLVSVLVTAMIIFAFKKALGVAKTMSGDFGDIGAGLGNKVLGLGLGMASGGATMAIGGAANKIFQSDRFQKMAAGEGGEGMLGKFVGRQGVSLADKTRNMTFDPRNIKLGGIGKGLGAGTGNKEGFMKKEEKWAKERQKTAKLMEVTAVEKEEMMKEISPKYKAAKESKESAERKRPSAEKAYAATKRELDSSEAGKRVREAQEQRTSYKMEGDKLVDKLEKLKTEAAKEKYDAVKEVLGKEVREVEKTLEENKKNLSEAETKLKQAETAKNESKEGRAFISAKETLDRIYTNINDANKEIKEAEKSEKGNIENINMRRRGKFGEASTLFRYYTTSKDRQDAIEKIRAGEPKEEKNRKEMAKILAEVMEKGGEAKEVVEEVRKKESETK